jgi:hypothetical protein
MNNNEETEFEFLDFQNMTPIWRDQFTLMILFTLIKPNPLLLKERWDE